MDRHWGKPLKKKWLNQQNAEDDSCPPDNPNSTMCYPLKLVQEPTVTSEHRKNEGLFTAFPVASYQTDYIRKSCTCNVRRRKKRIL